MKKILFVILVLIFIVLIFMTNNYQSNIVMTFGNNKNSNYVYKYNDTRIIDIINDINNNIKIHDRNIQNILVKADTIYIDLNGLDINIYKILKEIENIENLIITIRRYSKENIVIQLLNDDNNINNFINRRIFNIKKKYGIIIKR